MTKFLDLQGLNTLVTKVKAEIKKVSDANISNSLKGAKNGVATLDGNGYVPLTQLGNLDTTVAEVVTALPTTGIKKHIYMVKASTTSSQNVYKEYIYTGDTSQTYDASKWEQLGEYKANIDLSEYLKRSDASNLYHPNIKSIIFDNSPNSGSEGAFLRMTLNTNDKSGGVGGYGVTVDMPNATSDLPGLMSEEDKRDLDTLKNIINDKADNDTGEFTSGVNTPVLVVNSNTADEPSKNKIYATGERGTSDIILQHANSTGAIDEVVKVNIDGIVVNAYSYRLGAIGNINNLDWTLTGSKTSITGMSVTSPKIVKTGGTSQQVLMADGSVATSITEEEIQALFN